MTGAGHALPVSTEVDARGRMQDLQDLAEVPAVGGVDLGRDVSVEGHQGIFPIRSSARAISAGGRTMSTQPLWTAH